MSPLDHALCLADVGVTLRLLRLRGTPPDAPCPTCCARRTAKLDPVADYEKGRSTGFGRSTLNSVHGIEGAIYVVL